MPVIAVPVQPSPKSHHVESMHGPPCATSARHVSVGSQYALSTHATFAHDAPTCAGCSAGPHWPGQHAMLHEPIRHTPVAHSRSKPHAAPCCSLPANICLHAAG